MPAAARTLAILPGTYAIVRLPPDAGLPAWAQRAGAHFTSLTRTRSELSVICPAGDIPPGQAASGGWHCLRIAGSSGLDEPGVLVSVADPIAAAGLSVFVIATHETDYLLVTDLDAATAALRAAGHHVAAGPGQCVTGS